MYSITRRICVTALRGHVRQCSIKEVSPWLLENKPGPYPKTEQERIAAAKKYGLLREEYEPFPDDGSGYGDYPNTTITPIESLSWEYPWTDNLSKRNFGDPIHPDASLYTYMRISEPRTKMPMWKCLFYFLLPIIFLVVAIENPYANIYGYRRHILEKQIPAPGVVHYTFDLVD